jgi:uncharacterized protein
MAIALVTVAIWAAITIGGGLLQAGHGSLGVLVTQRIVLATPVAAAFLLVVAWRMGWRDLGLYAPRPPGASWLLWPVGVYVVGLLALAAFTKTIPAGVIAVVIINTMVVGFSEELAFRGVLWGAARKAMAFWPGVLLVSALFGSVHILNALITGQLGEAVIQAFNAALSGFGYLALRIRTKSLLPIMIGHFLWDLAVFLVGYRPIGAPVSTEAPASMLWGAAFVAPVALYGLWLLRKAEYRTITDDNEVSTMGHAQPAG